MSSSIMKTVLACGSDIATTPVFEARSVRRRISEVSNERPPGLMERVAAF